MFGSRYFLRFEINKSLLLKSSCMIGISVRILICFRKKYIYMPIRSPRAVIYFKLCSLGLFNFVIYSYLELVMKIFAMLFSMHILTTNNFICVFVFTKTHNSKVYIMTDLIKSYITVIFLIYKWESLALSLKPFFHRKQKEIKRVLNWLFKIILNHPCSTKF